MSAATRAYLDAWRAPKRVLPRAARKPTLAHCEFCHNAFDRTGRADRPRRTCSLVCAAGLRRRQKQLRALARFRAARACRFLSFPKTG